MSYHKFPNLGQQFQSDLTLKLTIDIKSMNFMDLPCNCNPKIRVNGECIFKGYCRKSVVIYKAKCELCKMKYFDNTQQKLKTRINQHLGEFSLLVNNNKTSDSSAKRFARHFLDRETKLTIGEIRNLVEVSIEWQGTSISCNNSFGKLN